LTQLWYSSSLFIKGYFRIDWYPYLNTNVFNLVVHIMNQIQIYLLTHLLTLFEFKKMLKSIKYSNASNLLTTFLLLISGIQRFSNFMQLLIITYYVSMAYATDILSLDHMIHQSRIVISRNLTKFQYFLLYWRYFLKILFHLNG